MSVIKFPPHKASLHLTHNDHTTNYQTVAEWWDDAQAMRRMDDEDWVSPEQKQKAIETNELWELQWYPDTPIGFHYLAAADLSALLEAAVARHGGEVFGSLSFPEEASDEADGGHQSNPIPREN